MVETHAAGFIEAIRGGAAFGLALPKLMSGRAPGSASARHATAGYRGNPCVARQRRETRDGRGDTAKTGLALWTKEFLPLATGFLRVAADVLSTGQLSRRPWRLPAQ
jgi:hypothetical protein